jgi:pyruvate/oxaloacetate carboxyltransferase
MAHVIQKGGFGTSVTPVSQIYFEQALLNVQFGPWKQLSERYALMVLGYYGKTPGDPDSKIIQLAQKKLGKNPTDKNPVDINGKDKTKGIKAAKEILKKNGIKINDENIFIVATCAKKGIDFLLGNAKLELFYADNITGLEAKKDPLFEEKEKIKKEISELNKSNQLLKIELSLNICEEYALKNPGLIKKVLEGLDLSLSRGTQGG